MKIRLLYKVIFPSLFTARAECAPVWSGGRRAQSAEPESQNKIIWIKIEILAGKEYTDS
jgi:hypothetical protein